METNPDSAKDNNKVDNATKAPEVVFETVYVDSAPKLRNPEHLVHYELGKSGNKHGIRITSNDNDGLFSNEWIMLDDIAKCLEPLAKIDNFCNFYEKFSAHLTNLSNISFELPSSKLK